MTMYSAVDDSERRDALAEETVRAAASAEVMADEEVVVKTGIAEDSVAVIETAEKTQAMVITPDTAEAGAAKTEENGTTATGKTQTVSPLQREQREKQKSERNGKSRASVTASLKEKDLNLMRKLVDLPQKPQLCFCGKSCIVREECIGNKQKGLRYENTEKTDTIYFAGSDASAPAWFKYHQSGSLAGFRYGGRDDFF